MQINVEHHYVRTNDGWNLHLKRKKLNNHRISNVVVLAHGWFTNGSLWDYHNGNGLAKFMAEHLYDTWIIEFRGHGLSIPKASKKVDWNFDSYIKQDLPAIMNYIKEYVEQRRITVITHSFASFPVLAYLGLQDPTSTLVKNLVAIAPAVFNLKYDRFIQKLTAKFLAELGRVTVGIFGFAPTRFLKFGPENEPRGAYFQVLDWVKNNKFRSFDKKVDYWQLLKNIKIPVFIITGRGNWLWGLPERCKILYDEIVSDHKEFEVFSKDRGFLEDYSHIGVVVGRKAEKDVWPLILKWIDKY